MRRVLGAAALLLGVAATALGSAGLASAQGSGSGGLVGDNDANTQPGPWSVVLQPPNAVLVPEGVADHSAQPTVFCGFSLAFSGFGTNQSADVEFIAIPPSGNDVPVQALISPTKFTFSGQTTKPYQLDVTGLTRTSQGYHIEVEPDLPLANGQPELDVYKDFWYQACATTTQTTTTTTTIPTQTTTSTSTTSTSTSTSTTIRPSTSSVPQSGSTTTSTTPPTATTTSPTTAAGGLAFTSGPTPSGAGTDLGLFSPGTGSSDLPWILTIAGGVLLSAAGLFSLNGNRIKKFLRRA